MPGITGIDVKTILLLTTIRELADMSKNGFIAFSEYHADNSDNYDKVVYDETKDVYPHKDDSDRIYHAYKIVAINVSDDVANTYDDIFDGVTIHVMIDDDEYNDDEFIEVSFGKDGENGVIIIRNGTYYVDYYGKRD